MNVVLDGNSLSIEQIAAVALAPAAREKVQRARDFLEKCVRDGIAIYGVTTGIGELARVRISQRGSSRTPTARPTSVDSHQDGTLPSFRDITRS